MVIGHFAETTGRSLEFCRSSFDISPHHKSSISCFIMYAKSSKISILQLLNSKLEIYKRLIEALWSDEEKEVDCFDETWLREAKQSRDGAYDVFLSFRGVDCRCQCLTEIWHYCDIFWGPSQFQLLDRTKDDTVMRQTDHSSFEKVHLSWMFCETRSNGQLGSEKIVCQDFGGKSNGDSQELFQLTSLDYQHYLPRQRISTLKRAQDLSLYTFPLQCTGSTLLKDIPTSVNQVKQMSTKGNRFSLDNNESRVAISIDFMEALKWDGKMTSQLPDYSTGCNLNKHKETMPRGPMSPVDDTLNQHKRKRTAQCVSSFGIVAYISLSLLVMCSQSLLGKHLVTTPMQVQPLHKEHGPMSIGVLLLDLFGFMVFIWAIVIKILVGAPFSGMQSAMLFLWAILMQIKTDYSISVVHVVLLGIFLVGRYAHGKATAKLED